jgi:hypothetical protein
MMGSVNPVDLGDHRPTIGRIVSEWYALNSDISRLWLYEAGAPDHDDRRDIHVVVALTPVNDSDDIGPIWLARCAGWERDLQGLIGHRVHLEWFDGDTELVPCAEDAERARVCVASVTWRDSSSGRAESVAHLRPVKGAIVSLRVTRKDGFDTLAEDVAGSTGPT